MLATVSQSLTPQRKAKLTLFFEHHGKGGGRFGKHVRQP